MPLINLQASPVWKQLFSVLSRIICRFLKQAREHDGTGASLQILALQVLPKEPCFVSRPHAQDSVLPSPSAHFGTSLTPALSVQGTQALRRAAGKRLFPPLGSLQGTWVTNWALKQQVGASQAPTLLLGWNNPSPLSVRCLDFSLRETYPGHPRGPLWPPQSIQHLTDLLKKWAVPLRSWINSSLSSYQRLRGVRQRHSHGGSPQKPPPAFSPCPIPSFFPRHSLDASAKHMHCAGAGRLHEVGTINHSVGCAAALAEKKEEHIDRSVHSINTSTQKRSPKVKTTTCFVKLPP